MASRPFVYILSAPISTKYDMDKPSAVVISIGNLKKKLAPSVPKIAYT